MHVQFWSTFCMYMGLSLSLCISFSLVAAAQPRQYKGDDKGAYSNENCFFTSRVKLRNVYLLSTCRSIYSWISPLGGERIQSLELRWFLARSPRRLPCMLVVDMHFNILLRELKTAMFCLTMPRKTNTMMESFIPAQCFCF